ncbi:MAG TPA: hypothetical protein VGN35_02730 [Jatrophihabitantaceae bacterium]|nr:hypothetical protein [Jatrophihabitantaceae bacterium]
MDNEDLIDTPRRHTGRGVKIALVGAGLAAGVIGATAFGASATTAGSGSTSSSAASSSTTAGSPAAPGAAADRHGSAPVRSDEKAVSSSVAATIKAAALKAVPGGTVYRVETDAGDGVYEAHMTKADGTDVTVKFDKNLAVTKVETGMGQGDPHPANGAGPGH